MAVIFDEKSSNCYVSEDGLTIKPNYPGNGAISRSGLRSNGKRYFEVYITDNPGTVNAGLVNEEYALGALSNWGCNIGIGSSNPCLVWKSSTLSYGQYIVTNGTSDEQYVASFAVDFENNTITIYVNGKPFLDSYDFSGDNYLANRGLMPKQFSGGGGNCGGQATWNFGSSPFVYEIPSGYIPWDETYSVNYRYSVTPLSVYLRNSIIDAEVMDNDCSILLLESNNNMLADKFPTQLTYQEIINSEKISLNIQDSSGTTIVKNNIPFRVEELYRNSLERTFLHIEGGYINKSLIKNNKIRCLY